ncbi:MAG: adenylosuccinate lyase, partial [Armatimonadaceae bacterium]
MSLTALSALDGRYAAAVAPLCDWFSEAALVRHRVLVEIRWLQALCAEPDLPAVRGLATQE